MTYRPALTPFWKSISIGLLMSFLLFIIISLWQIISQKKDENFLKATTVQGIVIDKRNLLRNGFAFVIEDKKEKKEYILSGSDQFYNKFSVGDSIKKRNNSFEFDVFKKDRNNAFIFCCTFGYK